MLKLAKILCPVDFSEYSSKAYEYAYSFARHYGAKLFVQHAAEPWLDLHRSYVSPEFIEQTYERQVTALEGQVRELIATHSRDNIEAETVIQFGSPADSILALAGNERVDLIAMGTHGRRGLDRLVLGSTLERVLRNAQCAVLAVHKPVRDFASPANPDDPIQLRRILWCTDFSEDSPRALEFALSLALEYHAEITLLHVLEAGEDTDQERHGMRLLEDVIPDEVRTWAEPVSLVLRGEPYRKIVEHADRAQTDLIVMGVRGRNIVDRAIFGSTTYRVIQLGPCPVLTVRT
ncbi:MAG TPA: universal stress protein [Bryobacteraceae bacterium]